MKYNLRSLMVVVTLVCVVLGRMAYLKFQATFHREELERLRLRGERIEDDEFWALVRHEESCKAYEDAFFRPWTIVREPQIRKEDYMHSAEHLAGR